MKWELYADQVERWPTEGQVILASYDEQSIVVYQAYNAAIAEWAVANQAFGGPWSFDRMSWIKTSFLWMMYRSGWATKPDQERVLAIRIHRPAFDALVEQAVPSSFDRKAYASREAWQDAVQHSAVRVQWDPDHDPHGNRVSRRAIQLGLRGPALRNFATRYIASIEDITAAVHDQHAVLQSAGLDALKTPVERVYPEA